MTVPNFRTFRVAPFASLVMALTAPEAELRAQRSHADSVRHRNECRLAEQVLLNGQPADKRNWAPGDYGWAAETIPRCTETGGPAVAAAWAYPQTDTVLLEWLFYASYTLRDARITKAVTAAALNQSLPQIVRLNAIRVLTGHAVPSFMLAIPDLTPENDSVKVVLGGISHVNVTEGAEPVGPETVAGIVETLTQLELDPDARVALAAAYVKGEVCGRLRSVAACHQG